MNHDSKRIMELYDDELDAEGRRVAEASVESEAEARGELRSLQILGEVVRHVHDRRGQGPDLTDAILTRVLAEPQPRGAARGNVRPLRKRLAPLAPILAVAAVLALLITAHRQTTPEPKSVAAPVAAPSSELEVAVVESGGGVSIQSVDFGSTQGAIFLVSAGEGETMVVWTLEDENDKG